MMQDRVCKTCKVSFKGGPRAYYCPSCRAERSKQTRKEYQSRKRKGLVRKLGSKDKCERCGNMYTVESGLQRFCPDCQPIHAAEYDRATSLPFYHAHKDRINPVRNERRRIGKINCHWCGSEFDPQGTSRLTCSDECKRLLKNKKWNEWSAKRKEKQ